jgi:iron complex transport system substrate-binding protein
MNKWSWLLLITLSWMGIGLAIPGFRHKQKCDATSLPGEVHRIVSMAPDLTEILFALRLDDEIVGVTIDSDYPPPAVLKSKIGTFWQPNIEAVIAARPDLVITLGFDQQKDTAERLKRIGYNCLTIDVWKVSDLFEAIEKIGIATGRQQQATKLANDIRSNLDRLSNLVGTQNKIKVLWVVQREPLRIAGRDTFVNELIELAGGENAIGPTLHKYPPIGAEQVIASDAEVIIEPAMGQQDIAMQQISAFNYWSRFKNLPAVINKKIFVIPGDTVSRLGPRIYDGTEIIAKCLRPELFPN